MERNRDCVDSSLLEDIGRDRGAIIGLLRWNLDFHGYLEGISVSAGFFYSSMMNPSPTGCQKVNCADKDIPDILMTVSFTKFQRKS